MKDVYEKANLVEKECMQYLKEHCGFKTFLHTAKIIVTEEGMAIPDIIGIRNDNKKYFIEIKDKNRRLKFNDNGIDKKNNEAYLFCQEKWQIPCVLLFRDNVETLKEHGVDSWFIDETGVGLWYGNLLNKLIKKRKDSPVTEGIGNGGHAVLYFPLSAMLPANKIWEERQTQLNFEVVR